MTYQMNVIDQDNIYTEKYLPHARLTFPYRFNYIKDSKLRTFATVMVKNEDHTLGNVVRM